MSIVVNTDFVGEYSVSKTCFNDLDKYITKYEEYYLCNLLGAELYALFITDLTATSPQIPQTARFLDIFNSFKIDDNSCLRSSEGIRNMLVQFIYFQFIRDSNYKKTATGVVLSNPEVATMSPYLGYNLVEAYNEGVHNYKEIQWYICDNDTDYPEENIQHLNSISGI